MFQKSLEYRTKPEFRKELLEKLERGEKIKVCLFESRISCWQYEKLYDLLKNSPYFEPVVVLKPFVFQGKETMISLMNDAYDILSLRVTMLSKDMTRKQISILMSRK